MGYGELKFLAVEDHEFQRGLLLKMLAHLGAGQVFAAANGREALQVIDSQGGSIDVIISDLDMPDMDGLEFVRRLGEARAPVAIILASALDGGLLESVEKMARAYGVDILGVIQKPITPEKLDALIKLHAQARVSRKPRSPVSATFAITEIAKGLKDDEFEPFFQPKVEIATGRIKGVEALARWRHPQLGIIEPASFIATLEVNDMIDALTAIMLKKSARFCREWRVASGLDVNVSVNLSIQSLTDVRFSEWVTQLVRDENLDPRCMILEVTESATTTDEGPALENLSRLRMRGFGLSIDDYGTGYSSMQRLATVAFSEIKIDQSFVTNAAAQQSARIILESSLNMAHKLNIVSVAEGIETLQDWDLVRRLGCDLAQGYLIARPMAGEDLLKWTWHGLGADHSEIALKQV